MKTQYPQHNSPSKDTKYQLNKINPQQISFGLDNSLQIVGFEQIQNNIPQEQYFHDFLEIEKHGYVFKREDASSEGPEYDKVCPLCSQFVTEGYYMVYSSKDLKRKFLSHYQCLIAKDSQPFKFVEVSEEINEAILRSDSSQPSRKQSIEGAKSYYATLTISHPISNLVYIKLDKRINDWNGEELEWEFGNKQAMLYSPTTVCMPYTDFKCHVSIDYKKFVKEHEFYVNLNRRESKKKSCVQVSTSSITFDIDYFVSAEQKESIISQMNFIYPYMKNQPVIRLNQIKIKIPEELDQVAECSSANKIATETGSFSSPIKNQNDYMYMPVQMPIPMPVQMPVQIPVCIEPQYYSRGLTPVHAQTMQNDYNMMGFSPMHITQQNMQEGGYYNEIEDIIQMGRIREFVETGNGSREFQKYLKKCTYEEVDQILNMCYDDLPGFIIHDYANYMFQGLVHACSPDQRIKVVNKIAFDISALSQNKKGTHSLQTLITIITTSQQRHIICKALEKDFIFLAQNINATHLIQKILQTFDSLYLIDFFNQLEKEFIRLCKNSHGICVLKCFMKKIQTNDEIIAKIVKNIADNLDSVIQDPFGNYIVQYAYETYGEGKCRKITNQIINNFTQYCIQKFSANVVDNCITNYCTDIQEDAIASIIEANSLEEMLKTPTGNSILLKLVRGSPNKEIEEKIRKILSLPRMSKHSNNWDSHFYNVNQKAATCKNVHGETYNNFSEAAQMAKNGKPKKGSFTPKAKKF